MFRIPRIAHDYYDVPERLTKKGITALSKAPPTITFAMVEKQGNLRLPALSASLEPHSAQDDILG